MIDLNERWFQGIWSRSLFRFLESVTASFVARKLFEKRFFKVSRRRLQKQYLQRNCLVALLKYIVVIVTDYHNSITNKNDIYLWRICTILNIDGSRCHVRRRRLFKFLYTSGFTLGNVKSLKVFQKICCKLYQASECERKVSCYPRDRIVSLNDTAVPKYKLCSF